MAIVVLILSIVITVLIGNVAFKNTIGTTGAYVKRYFVIWVITFILLATLVGKLGLI